MKFEDDYLDNPGDEDELEENTDTTSSTDDNEEDTDSEY